jgi:hypothetical protein
MLHAASVNAQPKQPNSSRRGGTARHRPHPEGRWSLDDERVESCILHHMKGRMWILDFFKVD